MPKITLKLFENLPLIKHGAVTDSDGDSVPTVPLKSEWQHHASSETACSQTNSSSLQHQSESPPLNGREVTLAHNVGVGRVCGGEAAACCHKFLNVSSHLSGHDVESKVRELWMHWLFYKYEPSQSSGEAAAKQSVWLDVIQTCKEFPRSGTLPYFQAFHQSFCPVSVALLHKTSTAGVWYCNVWRGG